MTDTDALAAIAERVDALLDEALRQCRSPFKYSVNSDHLDLTPEAVRTINEARRHLAAALPDVRRRLPWAAVHLAETVNIIGRLLP